MSKYRGTAHEGPARTSPYPVSRLAAPHDLVELAVQIQQADAMLGATTGGKLEAIARQIRALQQEARETMETARRDAELHRATCRFRKRPGQSYHLYEDPRTGLYFSMLSPEEWGGSPPHPHRGSYRLEADMRWTRLEEAEARDTERMQLQALLPAAIPHSQGGSGDRG